MKRVLCGVLLGAAALVSSPAQAYEAIRVEPTYTASNEGFSVGARYSRDGGRTWQPIGGARVSGGQVCVGLSYQVPQCVEIETDR
jgi:hypothetical protein